MSTILRGWFVWAAVAYTVQCNTYKWGHSPSHFPIGSNSSRVTRLSSMSTKYFHIQKIKYSPHTHFHIITWQESPLSYWQTTPSITRPCIYLSLIFLTHTHIHTKIIWRFATELLKCQRLHMLQPWPVISNLFLNPAPISPTPSALVVSLLPAFL